ncbi:helix-hairpin-helix domain-containing protein [Priestia megaterium]|uniref:helix-hairpin-helix domain-containing protein n=1 Tax=Priestia megaterium TaxID=1404 RepID=UPI0027E165D2|nr:OB-fold nucleic acid binding domain-containing protein [Priestia megaterium]
MPPLIGASSHEFKVDNERIVFALNAIRGVGASAIKQIIQNRPYANFDDFIASNVFKGSEVKKGCIVGLIKAGAFDDTDPDRIEIMERYGATRPKKERTEKPLVTNEDWLDPEATMLRWEREVLGLYLSGHPLGKYSFVPYESIPVGGKATVGGEINRIKKIKTKRKQDMAFATLSTPEGNREITIFPRQYTKYADLLEEGKMLIIDGKKEEENILAERIRKA